jgi:hypothetical protein
MRRFIKVSVIGISFLIASTAVADLCSNKPASGYTTTTFQVSALGGWQTGVGNSQALNLGDLGKIVTKKSGETCAIACYLDKTCYSWIEYLSYCAKLTEKAKYKSIVLKGQEINGVEVVYKQIGWGVCKGCVDNRPACPQGSACTNNQCISNDTTSGKCGSIKNSDGVDVVVDCPDNIKCHASNKCIKLNDFPIPCGGIWQCPATMHCSGSMCVNTLK